MRVKEESEEVVLKLNTQKTKITASHHFMANEEKVEVVTDFIFLGSKIILSLPLPQSPKDCSIHLCVFSVSHIGLTLSAF